MALVLTHSPVYILYSKTRFKQGALAAKTQVYFAQNQENILFELRASASHAYEIKLDRLKIVIRQYSVREAAVSQSMHHYMTLYHTTLVFLDILLASI